MLDAEEAARRKENAIARAKAKMSKKFRAKCVGKSLFALKRFRYYTTDLIEELGIPQIGKKKTGLGPVTNELKKLGVMEYTGYHVESRLPANHKRPKKIYRSLIFDPQLEHDGAVGEMLGVVADIEEELNARRSH